MTLKVSWRNIGTFTTLESSLGGNRPLGDTNPKYSTLFSEFYLYIFIFKLAQFDILCIWHLRASVIKTDINKWCTSFPTGRVEFCAHLTQQNYFSLDVKSNNTCRSHKLTSNTKRKTVPHEELNDPRFKTVYSLSLDSNQGVHAQSVFWNALWSIVSCLLLVYFNTLV